MKYTLSTIFIFCFCSFISFTTAAQLANVQLQCEHLSNPLGLDVFQPRFSWRVINWKEEQQTAYQILIAKDSNKLLQSKAIIWNSGKAPTDSQLIVYTGKPLEPFTRYYWKLTLWDNRNKKITSPIASFATGMIGIHNWNGEWITDTKDMSLRGAAYFRKAFSTSKKIISARAYITAAGLYELYINGNKIGDHFLDPMFTRYDRRNLYVVYDVTEQLNAGKNAIGVLLGNGWYNMQAGAAWGFNKVPWRGRPRFCLDVHIKFSDGTEQIISSGKEWKTILSPITYNSIYVGEHFDANKEKPDWDDPNYDDANWQDPIIATSPSQNIRAQSLYPIRKTEKIIPVSVKKFSDTDYVFDLGKNISGISELTAKSQKGIILKLKHAEQLDGEGHADQTGIDQHYYDGDSIPFQTDIYISNGQEETFSPHFNYKGFQYVEVTSNKPLHLEKGNLAAYFVHSDVPIAGKIETSNLLMNKIWDATNNSYLSNLMGYPTDCPQREKNGWTGDAHVAVETGLYNFDAITIYEKWLADFRDAQQPDGRLPAIVPAGQWWGYDNHNGPDWVSAIAIIPWELYQFYGDIRPLADNYEAIKSYLRLIERKYPGGLCDWGLGDWVPIKSFAPVEFTSTVYYYTDATILAKTALVLHKNADAIYFANLAERIKAVFNKKYLDEATGNYGQGVQTELSAALYWKLVPAGLVAKTAKLLQERVIADGSKLDVGLLGSKTILNALSENGYAELAYQLASGDQYGSWGYWVSHGATTLYEGWDIGKKLPYSLNHIMFGEVSAWMYKGLGGINIDPRHPAFKNILLKPNFVTGLDHFYCEHDGPYGKIISSWKRNGNQIFYDITIPANSTADLFLGKKTQRLSSGSYHFTVNNN